MFGRENTFSNKNVDQQVSFMNKVLTKIFTYFIPIKLVTFNDKDSLWINDYVRNKTHRKNKIRNSTVKNGRTLNNYKKNFTGLILETMDMKVFPENKLFHFY